VLALTLAVHAMAALAAPPVFRRAGRLAFLLPAAASVASLGLLGAPISAALRGVPQTETYRWVPGLGLSIDLRLDAFSALMALLILGIQLLVVTYASGYFTSPRPEIGRFVANLTAFAGAMLGLVLADNILLIFAFWELTSVTSYLLIGTDDRRSSARAAALQALLTTGVGGLAMLGGFVLIGQAAGTYALSEILAAPPEGGATVTVGLVLVLLGAFTKSAQAPFHGWLPGAMAAPTPVSAYLHSATMVKAGIYLIARFAPAFAEVPVWRPLVLWVGATTMLVGGWRALRQYDLKLILAYGTISQLGFLTLLVGAGYPETTLAGVAVLLAHASFKAALFMTVGIVDHQTHTRDVRRLSGLGRVLRPTAAIAVLAAASMAGLPPLFGFVAKEAAFESLLGRSDPAGVALLVAVVAGSILTVAYTARYVWGAFATKQADELGEVVEPASTSPSAALVGPAAVLAALGVALGVWPAGGSPLVVGAARSLDAGVPDYPLALWHGFNVALALSMVAVVAGLLAWRSRRLVARWQAALPRVVDGGRAYQASLDGVLVGAKRVTAVVQNGSLPIYLGVILTTALVLPGVLLVRGGVTLPELQLADHPMQPVAVAVIVAGATAVCGLRRRFAAVLGLGAVGYGTAVLFVLQGAPDLALTQLLVETLVLVLFVLVLRHLPKDFEQHRWRLGQAPRTLIAAGVGVLAMVLTAAAVAARQASPVSDEMLARSVPDGGGRNVVNVILVDFRGFDTFGEIVVLTATALGVVALVRAARRDRRRDDEPTPPGLTQIPRRHRSIVLETGIRAVFRPLVLFSVYLLFAGHNDPGGGFIGGLVAGAALILLAVGLGNEEFRHRVPLRSEWLLGSGILVATASAALGWLDGGFLTRVSTEVTVPLLGPLYLSSTASFDVGVYLVVVGLVIALLRSLGSEEVAA